MRILTLVVFVVGACVCGLHAIAQQQKAQASSVDSIKSMPADADPSFEVATIKPTDPSDRSTGFHLDGQRIWIENVSLDKMLTFAFDVHAEQIVGAPSWFATENFDIQGIPDVAGQPDVKQMKSMLRKLLTDRLQFKFHHAQQELPIYAIRAAKGGPKLTKSDDQNALQSDNNQRSAGQITMTARNMPMASFVTELDFFMDRPVIDQTNLTGKWDFTWRWTQDETRVSSDPNPAPGLFTAIQEQLGLKIEAIKAPIDVLVIDHAERPSAN